MSSEKTMEITLTNKSINGLYNGQHNDWLRQDTISTIILDFEDPALFEYGFPYILFHKNVECLMLKQCSQRTLMSLSRYVYLLDKLEEVHVYLGEEKLYNVRDVLGAFPFHRVPTLKHLRIHPCGLLDADYIKEASKQLLQYYSSSSIGRRIPLRCIYFPVLNWTYTQFRNAWVNLSDKNRAFPVLEKDKNGTYMIPAWLFSALASGCNNRNVFMSIMRRVFKIAHVDVRYPYKDPLPSVQYCKDSRYPPSLQLECMRIGIIEASLILPNITQVNLNNWITSLRHGPRHYKKFILHDDFTENGYAMFEILFMLPPDITFDYIESKVSANFFDFVGWKKYFRWNLHVKRYVLNIYELTPGSSIVHELQEMEKRLAWFPYLEQIEVHFTDLNKVIHIIHFLTRFWTLLMCLQRHTAACQKVAGDVYLLKHIRSFLM